MFAAICDGYLLPQKMPFSVMNPSHRFQAQTFFNVLLSAKDFDTFYKTAVWARQHVNEEMFFHVMSTVLLQYPHTKDYVMPHIYEVFPSYFYNGMVMNTVHMALHHGAEVVKHYDDVEVINDVVYINASKCYWPQYKSEDFVLDYYMSDHELNTAYYNTFISHTPWLGGKDVVKAKVRRGEWFWFLHKQLLSRYYMERLSNGLGEVEELSLDLPVENGFYSGLVYHNGIPFPERQNHFELKEHREYLDYLIDIREYEHRIRDAIDRGYIVKVS